MPWKFVFDLRFHGVLQTTIIRQITKWNEEIKKQSKNSQNPLELRTNLYVCVRGSYSSVLLCVDV